LIRREVGTVCGGGGKNVLGYTVGATRGHNRGPLRMGKRCGDSLRERGAANGGDKSGGPGRDIGLFKKGGRKDRGVLGEGNTSGGVVFLEERGARGNEGYSPLSGYPEEETMVAHEISFPTWRKAFPPPWKKRGSESLQEAPLPVTQKVILHSLSTPPLLLMKRGEGGGNLPLF